MTVLYFATLFDSNYLTKGLALHSSMKNHIRGFKLFVLCLDDITFDLLTALSHAEIHPVKLCELEKNDRELRIAKENRTTIEYYFTLSPVLPLFILTAFKEVDVITTLDADLYFFNDPQTIYNDFEGHSILITPHRFPSKLKHKEKFGLYNVSFQAFRNDSSGLECLQWWRNKCLEWCYDKFDGDRFADQKYLDDWTLRFKGVMVLSSEGAGLAPWNVDDHKIKKKGGKIYSNNELLVFYHFHHLKSINRRLFIHGVDLYSSRMTQALKNLVYHRYLNQLINLGDQLKLKSVNHNIRVISAPKSYDKKLLLQTYSMLLNFRFIYTIEINLKEPLRLLKKILKTFKISIMYIYGTFN